MVTSDFNSEGRVNINSELLTHRRFANDIVLITETTNQSQAMLTELNNRSSAVSLKMNHMKTKFKRSENFPQGRIVVERDKIEEMKE